MSDSSLLDGKNILAVDDEPDILEVLEEILPMCRVVKAVNAEEAEKLLASQNFDVAILDIMGVDGYKLLNLAVGKNIPAVMLTAHAFTPRDIVKSLKGGATYYMPKEEIAQIDEVLIDILTAKKEGRHPWEHWQQRLPSSYFEKRFGATWQDVDKQFWETFKASIRTKKSGPVEES